MIYYQLFSDNYDATHYLNIPNSASQLDLKHNAGKTQKM